MMELIFSGLLVLALVAVGVFVLFKLLVLLMQCVLLLIERISHIISRAVFQERERAKRRIDS